MIQDEEEGGGEWGGSRTNKATFATLSEVPYLDCAYQGHAFLDRYIGCMIVSPYLYSHYVFTSAVARATHLNRRVCVHEVQK